MLSHYIDGSGKKSHYIHWNFLVFLGLGLWVALCASNMYRSDAFGEVTLIYPRNWYSGTAYNTVTKVEATEFEPYIITKNNLDIVPTLIVIVLVFVCIAIAVCTNGCISTKIETLKIVLRNMCENSYMRNIKNCLTICPVNLSMLVSKTDQKTLQSGQFVNCGIVNEYAKGELNLSGESEECSMNDVVNEEFNANYLSLNILQDENTCSRYTLLLLNIYGSYCYFNNYQITSNYKMLVERYSMYQRSKHEKDNLGLSKNGRNNKKTLLKNRVRKKGIISSSPEFKKFLSNLDLSQYTCPYMLEVSTNYVIRIKSIGC